MRSASASRWCDKHLMVEVHARLETVVIAAGAGSFVHFLRMV